MRKRTLAFVAGLVGGPLVSGICLSLALYEYGLSLVPGPPERTLPLATPVEAAEAWREVERSERIEVRRLAPWDPVLQLLFCEQLGDMWPGQRAAAYVGARYLARSAPRLGSLKRQAAWSATIIWLTRHWSPEELASEVARLEAQHKAALRRPPGRPPRTRRRGGSC